MIRFRCAEDEQRYNDLRTQIYVRVAAGLPVKVANEVLRNLGKLEALLHLEGLRQGVAAEALYNVSVEAERPICQPSKAYQLHCAVYGSSDTPLRDAELEWLQRLDCDEMYMSETALDPKPMRFAPTTLAEAVVEGRIVYKQEELLGDPTPVPVRPLSDDELEAVLAGGDDEPQSPDAVDRVRGTLQEMLAAGWRPADWSALIMKLHQRLGMDAFFLDLQLSGPSGRAMLDQCGLVEVRPGSAVTIQDFSGPLIGVGDPDP